MVRVISMLGLLAVGALALLLVLLLAASVVSLLRHPKAALGCLGVLAVGAVVFLALGTMVGYRQAELARREAARRELDRIGEALRQRREAALREEAARDEPAGTSGRRQDQAAESTEAAGRSAPPGSETGEAAALPAIDEIPLDDDERPAGGPAERRGPPVVIPPGRPEWVERPPVRSGPVHTVAVASGLFRRQWECRRELDRQLQLAVDDYVNWFLDNPRAARWLSYSADEIRRRLVRPENLYDEQILVSVGPMRQSHALVEFPESFRRELQERWRRVQAASRTIAAAGAFLLALAAIGVLALYYRALAAGRIRRVWLRLGTAAAILALAAAGLAGARALPWL